MINRPSIPDGWLNQNKHLVTTKDTVQQLLATVQRNVSEKLWEGVDHATEQTIYKDT